MSPTVINGFRFRYPAFGNYGRLIFPVNTHYFSGSALGNLSLTWYTEIRPEKTVEISKMRRHKRHIAPHYVMQARINQIRANGTNAEIEVFPGLDHGFGIGTGTVAKGWVGREIAFWEKQNLYPASPQKR